MTLTTTLAEIRSHGPCADRFAKIRDRFGVSAGDAKAHTDPFPVALLLETKSLGDAFWVFDRVAPQSMKDQFLIRRLDEGEYSALKSLRENKVEADWWRECEKAVVDVVALLKRRLAGEDVKEEMQKAASAASAARAAARAASATDAAYVATYIADVATHVADIAAFVGIATHAANVAIVAAFVANVAANVVLAAAEHDLREVLAELQEEIGG